VQPLDLIPPMPQGRLYMHTALRLSVASIRATAACTSSPAHSLLLKQCSRAADVQ
jgi:hypothetical protein